jgi:hypothetical protein
MRRVPKEGVAEIIAESHRCVLKAHGVVLAEDLIDELARNAAHVLKLTAEADEADEAEAGRVQKTKEVTE